MRPRVTPPGPPVAYIAEAEPVSVGDHLPVVVGGEPDLVEFEGVRGDPDVGPCGGGMAAWAGELPMRDPVAVAATVAPATCRGAVC